MHIQFFPTRTNALYIFQLSIFSSSLYFPEHLYVWENLKKAICVGNGGNKVW